MVHSIHKGEARLIVRMQKTIVILMERRPIKTSAVGGQYEIVLHFIKLEMFAMLAPQVHQVSIKKECLLEWGSFQVLVHPFL